MEVDLNCSIKLKIESITPIMRDGEQLFKVNLVSSVPLGFLKQIQDNEIVLYFKD